MKNISTVRTVGALIIALSSGIYGASTIKPARPTHYFYTPTAYLNDDFDLVASLHEAAYTLPYHLQMHTSLIDNVGRICFGARYGILPNLSVGAGVAWSIADFGMGGHAVHHEYEPRFGTFLTWGFVRESSFEAALTPHMQLGNHISMGGDYGMMITPNVFWSIIGEFGFSFDFTDTEPYFNTVWGARVHPPQIPFLSFDGGVDFVESRPEDFAQHFGPFIDVIYTMKTKW
jgi:hypothetical protein